MGDMEALYLNHKEIYVLLGLLEAPIAFGIEDPFSALSDQKIKTEWEEVIIDLKDRELVGKGKMEYSGSMKK
ncbi:hypothetical protein MUO14_06345 [Halobacillus shinanisalinarum]|uniref:Uncharacterized protein n=1 Tax=Halobacillus shinanisalinarum TaxID=2932258 RepID=A0ABY4H301_9BACI|nr:hypothetical protein [Halobacillus shinanisalinarum]UOQ94566.1 hypothetical protein MUO14_06345 [Halobacillus shinanisalinarum]